MIADIIPNKKLPRSLSVLSYLVPKNLEAKIKVGQLATIPLRQDLVTGLVVALHANQATRHYPLKYLSSLVNEKIIFTPDQIALFILLADYYAASASLFVHHNLPKMLASDWAHLPMPAKSDSPSPSLAKYFWWLSYPLKYQHYQKLISSASSTGQVLIIVPKISDLETMAAGLALGPNDYLAIHGQLSRAEYFNCWQAAIAGQPKIFIGTRSACFFPYTKLKLIIIDDEHSSDHKQADLTPRYEVKKVCQELSQLTGATLIFSSPSPSLSSFQQFTPRVPKSHWSVSLINLNYELESKNYTFISDPLSAALKKTLAKHQKIFLLVNKKGSASTNRCSDCGYTLVCPDCSLPLIKETDTRLACYYCHHHEDFPPFCPQCGGPSFQALGLGTEKIASYLRHSLPQAKISVIDSNAKTPPPADAEIIVGTEFAIDKINWDQIKLLGLVNADELWHHAEFMSGERAYQNILDLLTRAPKNAKIIFQTFSPDSPIIQAIIQNNPSLFYQSESAFRKKFHYPPFASLIKISALNPQESLAEKSAQKLYQKISTTDPTLEISEPFPITRKKIRGQYKYNLILKLPEQSALPAFIKQLPSDFLMDINPQTLLD